MPILNIFGGPVFDEQHVIIFLILAVAFLVLMQTGIILGIILIIITQMNKKAWSAMRVRKMYIISLVLILSNIFLIDVPLILNAIK